MLANYLADVEQNLDEQRYDLALRDAMDLPQIAVALTDPALRVSRARCKAWCIEWLRPVKESNQTELDQEHICQIVERRLDKNAATETVPAGALRRLRLRRHARMAPRIFSDKRTVEQSDAGKLSACTAMVEAMRRWYAHVACHHATAQANLARLAVLR